MISLGNGVVLAVNIVAVVVSVLAMFYWVRIYQKLYKSSRSEVQGWVWLSVAVLGLLLFNISSIYVVFRQSQAYELMNIIGRTIITVSMTVGGYLLYSPLRNGSLYRFVAVTPVAEKEGGETALRDVLKAGHSYLLPEDKAEKSSRLFVNLVTHGAQGLYISRRYPGEVRDAYGLKLTPIIWLTHEKQVRGILTLRIWLSCLIR